jgi:hypothetical protein
MKSTDPEAPVLRTPSGGLLFRGGGTKRRNRCPACLSETSTVHNISRRGSEAGPRHYREPLLAQAGQGFFAHSQVRRRGNEPSVDSPMALGLGVGRLRGGQSKRFARLVPIL